VGDYAVARVSVPDPEVSAGLSTAAEDRLNIRAQSVHFYCGIVGDTEGARPH
jgi:hypothetical protein